MKKYVIQDVTDKQYYCDDNTWSADVSDAILFDILQDAWNKAIEINKEKQYVLTVIPILY